MTLAPSSPSRMCNRHLSDGPFDLARTQTSNMNTATVGRNGLANAGRIVVSYAGVHQAYQLALAAQEMGELKAFYCSLYDAPKKWGGMIAGLVGHECVR